MTEEEYDRLLKMTKTGRFELIMRDLAARESSKAIVTSSSSVKKCH